MLLGPRLVRPRGGAFEIDALMPEPDGVILDYWGYDGQPVRTFPLHNDGQDQPYLLRADQSGCLSLATFCRPWLPEALCTLLHKNAEHSCPRGVAAWNLL